MQDKILNLIIIKDPLEMYGYGLFFGINGSGDKMLILWYFKTWE